MRSLRDKMFESWNIRPIFIWDFLSTSYTKITYLVDLKREAVIYPFSIEDLIPFMHREVFELMKEFTEEVFPEGDQGN